MNNVLDLERAGDRGRRPLAYLAAWDVHHANLFGRVELTERLLAFQARYAKIARPFEWTFTRADLDRVLAKVADREPHLELVA